MSRVPYRHPKQWKSLTEQDKRDIRLWLGWSAIAGHHFASGREAGIALIRESRAKYRDDWFAMPRAFRKMLVRETIRAQDERIANSA